MSHLRALSLIVLVTAVRQAVGAVNGTGVDLGNYSGECRIKLNAAANTGDHTLAVKLQHSSDNGVADAFADTGDTFATVATTASAEELAVNIDKFKRYVRAVSTVAGTSTPVSTFSMIILAKKDRT